MPSGWARRVPSIVTYQARVYFEQAKYTALLEKFGAEGLPPAPRLEILLLRAQAQMALSQFDAAMSSAQQAEQVPGGAARALALQARIHLNAGRPADARTSVARALKLAPRDADAWNMQASIAHADGNLNQAVPDYARALTFQPDHLDARLAHAGLLLDLKRDAEAKVDLDYLQKQFAFDPRGAYLRALYYGRRGDQVRGARSAHRSHPHAVAVSTRIRGQPRTVAIAGRTGALRAE